MIPGVQRSDSASDSELRRLDALRFPGGGNAAIGADSHPVVPIRVAGPWVRLAPGARSLSKQIWSDVVKLLIHALTATIGQVAAARRGVGRRLRVESRGVFDSQFQDEILPESDGAQRVPRVFGLALHGQEVSA